jgi:hypothetical protein
MNNAASFRDQQTLRLSDREIRLLQQLLDAGDRGGFYVAYYQMTGQRQAMEQGQIATFSSNVGGIAWATNALMQTRLPRGVYPGIYFMSQGVAQFALEGAERSVTYNTSAGSGYLTEQQMFQTASDAWIAWWERERPGTGRPIGHLFPGNLIRGLAIGGELTQAAYDEWVATVGLTAPPTAGAANSLGEILSLLFAQGRLNEAGFQDFLNNFLSTGSLAAMVGSFATVFGKRPSDFENNPDYELLTVAY